VTGSRCSRTLKVGHTSTVRRVLTNGDRRGTGGVLVFQRQISFQLSKTVRDVGRDGNDLSVAIRAGEKTYVGPLHQMPGALDGLQESPQADKMCVAKT
jgi:hypothetical protein